eukprot:GILK01004928.1.p1 GENE.GILK01004928.1~~GILK01004928.1.p1  ORF type:complete len:483 (-),score=76.30 GILK01004928.1:155-1603(-)
MSAPVVIVGAGLSGLYAGKLLRERGIDVVVVEASEAIGGRTRQLSGFVNWNLDLGAEYVHGENSLVKRLADQNGWECRSVFNLSTHIKLLNSAEDLKLAREYIYLGKEKKLVLFHDSSETDLVKMLEIMGKMSGEKITDSLPVSAYQYLVQNGVPFRMLSMADALLAKTYGTSLDNLGVRESLEEEGSWDSGTQNFRLRRGYKPVVDWCSAGLNIKTSWPVSAIDYSSPSSVTLRNTRGESIQASSVIVAVPLTILKDGDVKFSPALPPSKVSAIDRMGMDGGVKIVCKFSRRFWPEKMTLVICDAFIPQVWMDETEHHELTPSGSTSSSSSSSLTSRLTMSNDKTDNTLYTVVGFAAGPEALRVGKLPPLTTVHSFIAQLNDMFGDESNPTPATTALLGYHVHDWAKEPFIRGGYSYPRVGSLGARHELVKPLGNGQVFFAGEAASLRCPATTEGAMDAAEKAVEKLLQSRSVPKQIASRL